MKNNLGRNLSVRLNDEYQKINMNTPMLAGIMRKQSIRPSSNTSSPLQNIKPDPKQKEETKVEQSSI